MNKLKTKAKINENEQKLIWNVTAITVSGNSGVASMKFNHTAIMAIMGIGVYPAPPCLLLNLDMFFNTEIITRL